MKEASPQTSLSRRHVLQLGLAGAAAGLTMGGFELSAPAALAQNISTADAAIAELMAGNKRFIVDNLTSQKENLEILRQHTEEKQQPFAAVLSCADSRVPVELVFDQSIGHVFVTRVAGNVLTPEVIGSLEYGAAVLGTKAILVMGHSNCGAVKATIKGDPVPGQISSLFPHIQPAVDQAGHDLEAATKANAKNQANLLRQASTVIAGLVKEGTLKVVAAYYDVRSGAATILE